MQVLLVRHAIAEDREKFATTGKPDSERPLTREGREKMRRAARGIAVLVPSINVVVSSPLRRALQTARLISAEYRDAESVEVESLSPGGDHSDTIAWLAAHANARCVALVGHEPSLGELFTLLLSRQGSSFHDFKKGGAALLSFEKKPAAGGARLEWAIHPDALRMVAKTSRG